MGVNAIALVLIASFAIDRIVNGILFVLSYIDWWNRRFPDPARLDGEQRTAAERRAKVVYFVIAGVIATFVFAYFGQVRVLTALGIPASPFFDVLLSGLILMGGSDRIADVLKMASGGGGGGAAERAAATRPIEIKGTLTLEQPHGATHVAATGPGYPV